MKIVAIIVTYNGENWIRKCLGSLENSNFPTEVIVVDNNSQDNTIDIIRAQFPKVEVIEQGVNLGFGKANNIGIQKAINHRADYILLLNQDAWIEENTIRRLIEVHLAFPEYGILSPIHKAGPTGIDLNFLKYLNSNYTPDILSDFILQKEMLKDVYDTSFVNAAFWLLPFSTVKKIGMFLPIFDHYGEDDNFLDRCRFHNLKVGIVPTVFCTHDRSQDFVSPENYSKQKFRNYVYSHLLAILLNPNNSKKEKTAKVILTVMKNFYRKPYSTIHSLLKIGFNSIEIYSQYIFSKTAQEI